MGRVRFHLSLPFCPSHPLGYFSFLTSLVGITSSWDRPGRRAKGGLQGAATARTEDRKRTVHNLAMISIGRIRVMIKQQNVCHTLPPCPQYSEPRNPSARRIPCGIVDLFSVCSGILDLCSKKKKPPSATPSYSHPARRRDPHGLFTT